MWEKSLATFVYISWWEYITCIRLTSMLREKSLAIIVCLGLVRDIIRNIIVITRYKV